MDGMKKYVPDRPGLTDKAMPDGKAENTAELPDQAPTKPDSLPDQQATQSSTDAGNIGTVLSGQASRVPDGWITRTMAQERFLLADVQIDSRRIRHLCARNELESVKVKNKKNQPQYFINPTSVDAYIVKNSPAPQSGTATKSPDHDPAPLTKDAQSSSPARPAEFGASPDQNRTKVPEQIKSIDMVPKAQLDQALETIEFLKEEIRDSRQLKRDLKEISSEMLVTFSTVATNRQLPTREPPQRTEPTHFNVHDNGIRDDDTEPSGV